MALNQIIIPTLSFTLPPAKQYSDSSIDFESVNSDLYKVDIEQTSGLDYVPRFVKIEDNIIKDPIIEYILAKPVEAQVKDISHQIMQIIGDMYPIPDQEMRSYINRVLNALNPEQLRDALIRKLPYANKIKQKTRSLADLHAEEQFNDLITIGCIS